MSVPRPVAGLEALYGNHGTRFTVITSVIGPDRTRACGTKLLQLAIPTQATGLCDPCGRFQFGRQAFFIANKTNVLEFTVARMERDITPRPNAVHNAIAPCDALRMSSSGRFALLLRAIHNAPTLLFRYQAPQAQGR